MSLNILIMQVILITLLIKISNKKQKIPCHMYIFVNRITDQMHDKQVIFIKS